MEQKEVMDLLFAISKDTKEYAKISTSRFLAPMFSRLNMKELSNHFTELGQPFVEETKVIEKRKITIRIEGERLT